MLTLPVTTIYRWSKACPEPTIIYDDASKKVLEPVELRLKFMAKLVKRLKCLKTRMNVLKHDDKLISKDYIGR